MCFGQDEDDIAQPIYRIGSQSFMSLTDCDEDERGRDDKTDQATALGTSDFEAPDDRSMIPQLADDGLARPHIEGDRGAKSLSANLMDDYQWGDRRNKEISTPRRRTDSDCAAPTHVTPTPAMDNPVETLKSQVRQVFSLIEDDVLVAHYPAWLLKSVLLKGHLYVMCNTLCFYAYIPRSEDITLKSGYLTKKSRTTNRQHRRWFVLRGHILTYYDDPNELYFPAGNIDLRNGVMAIADVKNSGPSDFGFKLVTDTQIFFFRADTASAAMEWLKVIQKTIFRLNNNGDTVKITVPYASILDVEESDVLSFASTMRIRIADDTETFTISEYLFSLFEESQDIIRAVRSRVTSTQNDITQDLTGTAHSSRVREIHDTSERAPAYHPLVESEYLTDVLAQDRATAANIELRAKHVIESHGRRQRAVSINNPFNRSRSRSRPLDPVSKLSKATPSSTVKSKLDQHTKTPSSAEQSGNLHNPLTTIGSFAKSAIAMGTGAAMAVPASVLRPVAGALAYSMQLPRSLRTKEPADPAPDAEHLAAAKTFHEQFCASEDERLLKVFPTFHVKGVPTHGDLFLSEDRICFKSNTLAFKSRIVLPLDDIERVQRNNGFTFAASGVVLLIRAHEDLFLEFTHATDRDQFIEFINGAIANLKTRRLLREDKEASKNEYRDMERQEYIRLEQARKAVGGSTEEYRPLLDNVVDAPAIIFDSPGASMVAFKPVKQLRFTCLTIGSRGDVQPYVALCKGLIADGQKAKIATHEEFRGFVQSHGIEFAPIDGNPAELMAICVEHGMFTYSFLREASRKFRGWIDDLLRSSWQACQNTDVLIESPSAMGGIHIAEALAIPYYRAFTMPWSKTRVYPHAFAVPDHNMGGNYNAFTYTAFDNLFWKAISGQVNRWRKKSLNLPATTYDKLAQHRTPFLYNFSPSVVPPARDWHDWIRVTGYWFLDGSDDTEHVKWKAPARVTHFIARARSEDKKLVYIGFGSIVVSDPKALTRAVIAAVKQSGVYCILVKGWSARSHEDGDEDEGDDSKTREDEKDDARDLGQGHEQGDVEDEAQDCEHEEQILSLDSIPHDWLFPQLDAACHHGGAGSLGASLRAGIPTIVKPFFGDQFFFGGRVQDLGVGVCLHKLTVSSLQKALEACTTDTSIIERAAKIGEQIRRERGVETAIENIYRDMEYARSLIERPERIATGGSESSGDSWQQVATADADDTEEVDDQDLFETGVDANGVRFSVLRPFRHIKLPTLGQKLGSYGLSRSVRSRANVETRKS